ncbi:MAG TPA: polysaccharide biosynthesis C-terminal domain-containing protein, partial [Vicinamibacterales bacterium]|nr:polysaccharide biosynthesis C-terminal domain-containing protein [Vicinamibacterales bacterium]
SNAVLFPVVVDSDATNRIERLQQVLLEGTRLSLATVVPIAATLMVLAQPLVLVWVGPKMLGSAIIIQILSLAVALRVGNATSTTLLKGAGRIRYLASVNIVTGLVNLALSAALVKPFGLPGVAIGTVLPVAVSSTFVLWPAACRRVRLPLGRAFHHAVWPAVWPGIVVAICLDLSRHAVPVTFVMVAAQAAAAGLLYLLLFGIAVGPSDRAQYAAKLMELFGGRDGLAPAA